MEILKNAVLEWLREILTSAVISNVTGLFSSVDREAARAASLVSQGPGEWNGSIYSLVRTLSDNVMIPIAGVILTYVMTAELIKMVLERNAGGGDTYMFFRWIIKSAVAVTLVSNTWNIIMAVFKIGGDLVSRVSGSVRGTGIDSLSLASSVGSQCRDMELGELLALWVETGVARVFVYIIAMAIFVASYSRMIEIYLTTSAAPLPFAMLMGGEERMIGQNYVRGILALGFQSFLMMLCVGIYSYLVATVPTGGNMSEAVWGTMAYSLLLAFALFRTGSLSKSIFSAH